MKYIDTHGHLNDRTLSQDVKLYLENANRMNVKKIIIPGSDASDSLLGIQIAKKHDNVYAMVSVHPTSAHNGDEYKYLGDIDPSSIVGVGECGIDLYRDTNPPLSNQIKVFEKHIEFGQKHHLPIIVHTRAAEQETIDIIKKYPDVQFIIHCSTSTKEWVQKFVKLNCYISFSGIVTFKNAVEVKEAMLSVPLSRLLCETDAPYLAPSPMRGKMNEPANVKYVADFIANERPEDVNIVLNALWNNAHKIFNI